MDGRFIDVLEIDAASSTGVDSIRELNRIADGKPSFGRFKVFIIDEVHMLSTAAFNAMLKTLEEPRAHMKFIMATTEIRKVPVTILSRCQRFDLRRIEPETMMAQSARHPCTGRRICCRRCACDSSSALPKAPCETPSPFWIRQSPTAPVKPRSPMSARCWASPTGAVSSTSST